jgi:Phytanoyl-CoA dioxygenase (PhyH)
MSGIASYLSGAVRPRMHRSLGLLKHQLNWHVTRNPGSRKLFAEHRPKLEDTQRSVLQELVTKGIAFVQAPDFGLDPVDWNRLQAMVAEFADSARVEEATQRFRSEIGRKAMKSDSYIVKLNEEGPTLSLDHPLLRLGLGGPLLDVVNSYLGLWSKLIYTDVWHTIPADVGQRIGSQFWHRDPEDRRMVKVYLYFSEVDATAGPMEYVLGSASGGPRGSLWAWTPHGSDHRYPREEEVDRAIPSSARVQCLGSPGTLIFCDTDGLHRGGVATARPRIAATWTFVTPASVGITSRRRFYLPAHEDLARLSAAGRFAVS